MSDQRRLWELGRGGSNSTEGIVTSIDWPAMLVDVNVNGVTKTMPWHGPAPWVGDRVRVITAGLSPVASMIMGAPLGTAATSSGGVTTVVGDDGKTYRYTHLGTAPSSGARVRLDHASRCILAGALTGTASGGEDNESSTPPPVKRSAWFAPVWSANWRYGAYAGPLVESSFSRVAAYGYGTAIADSIPDSAEITRAEWHLIMNRDNVGANPAQAGMHGHVGQPGNMPSSDLTGTIVVPSGSRAIDIRGGVADALKTGSARGLGFYPNSMWWVQYAAAPQSGRIYIEWRL